MCIPTGIKCGRCRNSLNICISDTDPLSRFRDPPWITRRLSIIILAFSPGRANTPGPSEINFSNCRDAFIGDVFTKFERLKRSAVSMRA